MFECVPTVLNQTGLEFRVQYAEINDEHILIRIRCDDMRPSGHLGTNQPAVLGERFTLSDTRGRSVRLLELNSAGSGPFAGIVDLAFPVTSEIDFDAPITLTSENAHVLLQLRRQ
jgi:hypothetical protein